MKDIKLERKVESSKVSRYGEREGREEVENTGECENGWRRNSWRNHVRVRKVKIKSQREMRSGIVNIERKGREYIERGRMEEEENNILLHHRL